MKKYLIILLVFVITGCTNSDDKQIVNVLNWSSYIPDSVLRDFEKEYNVKVNYGTYSSNEELLAKITSSKEGTYDVIFPSDYMTELLISKGLLEKLDKHNIPNYKNINEMFLNQSYDYNNEYSLPFLSTIVVIAVNRDHIKDSITGYNDLSREKYKNDIVLLDDQRIVIGLALLAKGYNMNETSTSALMEAKNWLLSLKKNIKAYDSDSPKTFFITEEADVGILWNAEAEIAQAENSNIEIIYPKEGHAISTDNYTIVKGSRNKENAYKFINYLLRSDVNKKIVDEYPYISPVNIVQSSQVRTYDIFDKGYYVKNIGSNIRNYDKIWADIK